MFKKRKYRCLEELGKLRGGYAVRSRVDNPKTATHKVLPIRGLSEVNPYHIDWFQLEPVIFEGKDENYLLKDGDVLFLVRGLSMKAAYVAHPPEKVLIFNNLSVLSPDRVDGRYLVWWFNHPQTQHRLSYKTRGSIQTFLPMSKLRDLKVPIPSQKIQQQIVELESLRCLEFELNQRLNQQRQLLFKAVTMKILEQD